MVNRTTNLQQEIDEREESLLELLAELKENCPLIPDAVTDYHMKRGTEQYINLGIIRIFKPGGVECDDLALKRLFSLSAQKFISDIAQDAMQHAKVRVQQQQRDKKAGAVLKDSKKIILTMEDLSNAMQERGVTIKKPEYFS